MKVLALILFMFTNTSHSMDDILKDFQSINSQTDFIYTLIDSYLEADQKTQQDMNALFEQIRILEDNMSWFEKNIFDPNSDDDLHCYEDLEEEIR